MALIKLFHWLDYFRQKRATENLSPADLLKQELFQIALALGVIIGGAALVVALISTFLK